MIQMCIVQGFAHGLLRKEGFVLGCNKLRLFKKYCIKRSKRENTSSRRLTISKSLRNCI